MKKFISYFILGFFAAIFGVNVAVASYSAIKLSGSTLTADVNGYKVANGGIDLIQLNGGTASAGQVLYSPLGTNLDWVTLSTIETDPVFNAWLVATPPIYTETDPLSWSKVSDQTLLTGDKSGSFDLVTTGTVRGERVDVNGNTYWKDDLFYRPTGISYPFVDSKVIDVYNQELWGAEDFSGQDVISVDWLNRRLYGGSFANNISLDWDLKRMYDSNGPVSISLDWENRYLYNGASPTLNWSSGLLYDSSLATSADWTQRILIDGSNVYAANWDFRYLIDSSSVQSVGWGDRKLYDSTGTTTSVDWEARQMFYADGGYSLLWGASALYTSGQAQVMDWENGQIFDTSEQLSIDWNQRALISPYNMAMFDWANGYIYDSTGNLVFELYTTQLYGVNGELMLSGFDLTSGASSGKHTLYETDGYPIMFFTGSETEGGLLPYTVYIGTADNDDVDYNLAFLGSTRQGYITWMEDEDYFKFSDDTLMNLTEATYYRATTQSINSPYTGYLDEKSSIVSRKFTPKMEVIGGTVGSEKINVVNYVAVNWSGTYPFTSTTTTGNSVTLTSANMVTPLVVGEMYLLQFTTSGTASGTMTVSCGGVSMPSEPTVATRQYYFRATSTADLVFSTNRTGVVLSGTSLKQVTNGDLFVSDAFEVAGITKLGNPATYQTTESTGDTYWVGSGSGVPYGHMYTNTDGTVTVASANTWYEFNVATPDMTTGLLNNVTFTDHYLTVLKAGTYEISVNAVLETTTAGDEIASTVAINGTASETAHGHATVAVGNAAVQTSGATILSLAANDQISLAVQNHSAARNITVTHAQISVKMVGGN